mgnify:CR=1 FL=1
MAIEQSCDSAAHWLEADYVQALENMAARRTVLVAEGDQGGIMGFAVARMIEHEWELENIAVVPERQKKGIGQALMRVLMEAARHSGANVFWLEVRASNAMARTLYERCGFAQVGVRKAYYRHPEEDAVRYRFLCTAE